MRSFLVVAIALLATAGAYAQTSPAKTCRTQATESKLTGTALESFMAKCEGEAHVKCDSAALKNSLSGGAKKSFTKKCVADAVGV